jgi:TadE-like protein
LPVRTNGKVTWKVVCGTFDTSMATVPHPRLTRSGARAQRAATALARPERARPARPARHRSRGQSLAEFALTFPMALLMVLFGLDFGRVFLGWVALNSAAREAANYAAMNPTAWTIPYNLSVQDEYERLVETEASNINCDLMDPIASPTFPDGTSIGAPASVVLTCQFGLITPFIALITGNPIPVSASSAFPVRAGLIESVPIATPSPATSVAPPSSVAPSDSPAPTETVDPSASGAPPTTAPTATPSPTATPTTCTVVSLLNLQTNKAAETWLEAGFTGTVIFSPLVPPHYKVAWQSQTVGWTISCASGVQVRSSAP